MDLPEESRKLPDGPAGKDRTDARCAVCRKPAPYRCVRCGKDHCSSHLRVMVGLCVRCGGGKAERGAPRVERDLAEVLGIKWLR